MRLVSISEDINTEKRIAVTPEVVKKYISLGIDVTLQENYGKHLGFDDKEYKNLGAVVEKNEKDILDKADVIVQVGLPSSEKLSYLKNNQALIGVLNPYLNKNKLDELIKKKINNFSLELLPRITRAQSMDILS